MEIRVNWGILGRDMLEQKFEWFRKYLVRGFVVCFGVDLEMQCGGILIIEVLFLVNSCLIGY